MHAENQIRAVELATAWVDALAKKNAAAAATTAAEEVATAAINKLDEAKKALTSHVPTGASIPRVIIRAPNSESGFVIVEMGAVRELRPQEVCIGEKPVTPNEATR